MNEEFIPYEQALALKELGFDEPCFGWYRSTLIPSNFTEYFLETEFGMNESPSDWVNSNFLDKACSAPLYQQAFRWFREEYSLEIILCPDCFNEPSKLLREYKIISIDKSIILDQCTDQKHWIRKGCFVSYEEAELECLKKLIEIIKNK